MNDYHSFWQVFLKMTWGIKCLNLKSSKIWSGFLKWDFYKSGLLLERIEKEFNLATITTMKEVFGLSRKEKRVIEFEWWNNILVKKM